MALDLFADGIEVAGFAGVHIPGRHGADAAGAPHERVGGKLFQQWRVAHLELLEALGVGLEQIQAGQGRCTSQGIGGEAVAVEEGGLRPFADEPLVEALAGHRCPHWQEATGEAFGECHQVGLNASPAAGKEIPGAAEACEHLIGDQQGAGGLDPLGYGPQEGRSHHPHAAGTLDQGFEDHGRGGRL